MDQRAFAAAKEKFQLAKIKFEAMKTATDLPHLAQLWGEFLTEQHRVFLRLKKAAEHGRGKGWFDVIAAEQRADDLLKYCLHARNAHEHGIERITNSTPSTMAIIPKVNRLFIKEMTIRTDANGTHITADPETMNNIFLNWNPGSVNLIAVKDRGQIYHPPFKHLNKIIEHPTPISVADMTVAYLESKISDAEIKFSQ
jgi:hypothetical protein